MNVFDLQLALSLAAVQQRTGIATFVSRINEISRICMYEGRVAWIHAGQRGGFLSQRLRSALDLDDAEFGRFMVGCRAAQQPLGEHLIRRGLMKPDEFRHLMRVHNTIHLDTLLQCVAPVELPLQFSDGGHRFDERFTFSIAELTEMSGSGHDDDDGRVDRSWVFSTRFDIDGNGPPDELSEVARWFVGSGETEFIECRPELPALVMVRAGRDVIAVECAEISFGRTLLQLREITAMVRTQEDSRSITPELPGAR